jgi:hypothetical protein
MKSLLIVLMLSAVLSAPAYAANLVLKISDAKRTPAPDARKPDVE